MKLKTYKLEKIEVDSAELTIPEETVYLFQTGKRRSIRVQPIFSTWQIDKGAEKEEVVQLKFTCIYRSFQCKIEDFNISVSEIEKIYNSKENSTEKEMIELLLSGDCYERLKSDFDADFSEALAKMNYL